MHVRVCGAVVDCHGQSKTLILQYRDLILPAVESVEQLIKSCQSPLFPFTNIDYMKLLNHRYYLWLNALVAVHV